MVGDPMSVDWIPVYTGMTTLKSGLSLRLHHLRQTAGNGPGERILTEVLKMKAKALVGALAAAGIVAAGAAGWHEHLRAPFSEAHAASAIASPAAVAAPAANPAATSLPLNGFTIVRNRVRSFTLAKSNVALGCGLYSFEARLL